MMIIQQWALAHLEQAAGCTTIVIQDHAGLLPDPRTDTWLNDFASEHGYEVIIALTNLELRRHLAQVRQKGIQHIIIVDRWPQPAAQAVKQRAPALLYPDLLYGELPQALLKVTAQHFLSDLTSDRSWPTTVDDRMIGRILVRDPQSTMAAHRNLRRSKPTGFADADVREIAAFVHLGIAEHAFSQDLAADEWLRIALASHRKVQDLGDVSPELLTVFQDRLRGAPVPFCWLADHDQESVVRAFYLFALLAQHCPKPGQAFAWIAPELSEFKSMNADQVLKQVAAMVERDRAQSHADIADVEESLTSEALEYLLLAEDTYDLRKPDDCVRLIECERLSPLLVSLALLVTLDSLLQQKVVLPHHRVEREFLFDGSNPILEHLYQLVELAMDTLDTLSQLKGALKTIATKPAGSVGIGQFRSWWTDSRICLAEYLSSRLSRDLATAAIMPRDAAALPAAFADVLARVLKAARIVEGTVGDDLARFNHAFEDVVQQGFPAWMRGESADVCVTSMFVDRCLRPYWDPTHEKAVLFILDGLRYDIWLAKFKPMFEARMNLEAELPGTALLPSETRISRKAISAGMPSDAFNPSRDRENDLLDHALKRSYGSSGPGLGVQPFQGAATGEAVRYSNGQLDVYIIDVCDKLLHHIGVKQTDGGEVVPERPLCHIYDAEIGDIVAHEMTSIVRDLKAGTKVFVTADHGFTRNGREKIYFPKEDLNEPGDAKYRVCRLKNPASSVYMPKEKQGAFLVFTPAELRTAAEEEVNNRDTGEKTIKKYASVVFPRAGFSFARPGNQFSPEAFTHGGVSLQEMIVPMVVLKVRGASELTLQVSDIVCPATVVEGQTISVNVHLSLGSTKKDAGRDVTVAADYQLFTEDGTRLGDLTAIATKRYLVGEDGVDARIEFIPNVAALSADVRTGGVALVDVRIDVRYGEDRSEVRRTVARRIRVGLDTERLVRPDTGLGKVLGLMPRKG
jgi:hypothetical protein